MKRRIGRSKIAAFSLLGILGLQQLIKLLGEEIFGTIYEKNIEPFITGKIYFLFPGVTIDNTKPVQEQLFGINIIWLCVILAALVIVIIIYTRNYYLKKISNRENDFEKLNSAMKALVADSEYIVAAQLYKYKISENRRQRQCHITIDHLLSRCISGLDINAVHHEEFSIPRDLYKSINRFNDITEKQNEFGEIKELDRARETINPVLQNLLKTFIELKPDTIEEKDCANYAIFKGIRNILTGEQLEDPVEGVAPEVANILLYGKRIGCLPAILLKSIYTFRNGVSHFKKDRTYLSFSPTQNILPMGYKNLLVVLTIPYEKTKDRRLKELAKKLVEEVNSYIVNQLEGGKNDGSDS